MATTWTEAGETQLRDLWENKEISASKIGKEMGYSKNAIISKANRMGLSMRVAGKHFQTVRAARAARPPGPKPAENPRNFWKTQAFQAEMAGAQQPPTGTKALIDLEPDECRFPYGEGPFTFCSKLRIPGVSYCFQHARQCFQLPGVTRTPAPAATDARADEKSKTEGVL